jgi:hypothetical protein
MIEAELARLRAENARLLKLLRLTPQQAAPPAPGSERRPGGHAPKVDVAVVVADGENGMRWPV